MPPSRTSLVAYRSSVVTPDTAEALRRLELAAAKIPGVKIHYRGVNSRDTAWGEADRGPTECPHDISMRPSGREVYLKVSSERSEHDNLALLWGLAVPLGFVPWNRHLVLGRGAEVFHFFGPWQVVYDSLCAEGRGESAWSSVCCAAQVDVGKWEGGRSTERFIQAQIHRVGIDIGPVDGVIGERTAQALQGLLVEGSLEDRAEALSKYRRPPVPATGAQVGHLILPTEDVVVVSYGGVASTKTGQGYALSVTGPGKIIIDVGGGS